MFYYTWTAFFGKKLHRSHTGSKEAETPARPNTTRSRPQGASSMSPSPGPLVAQTGRAGGSHAATTRLLQAPSSSLPVCVCGGGLPIAVGSVHVPLLVLSGTAREGARLHGQRTERGLLRETATRFSCWVSASPQGKERPRNRSSSWHPSLSAKARRPLRTRVCRAPRASARPGAPRASPAPLALLSAFHLAADLAF